LTRERNAKFNLEVFPSAGVEIQVLKKFGGGHCYLLEICAAVRSQEHRGFHRGATEGTK
jgi:hypothetical protein